MSNTAIKTIADLIIEEAKVENSDNSLTGSIGHVQHLVMMEVLRRLDDIRRAERTRRDSGATCHRCHRNAKQCKCEFPLRAERAWQLKKEIVGE